MKYYETKIGKIIEEESDARMDGAILTYIIDKGWENVEKITDKQIEEIKGNGFTSQSFLQSLVRAARRITRECSMYDDFLPYIRLYIGINGCQTNDITLYRDEYNIFDWADKLNKFNIDYEESATEIKSVNLVCIVDGVKYKEVYGKEK